MTFDEYQNLAGTTAIYPNRGNNLTYPTLGLCGESGEVAERVKKVMRDSNGVLTDDLREKVAYEASDVLWYLAALAFEIGIPLSQIAEMNIAKLAKRKVDGKLHGDGSER